MVKLGLDNFVKTISVEEFHDQNERLSKIRQEEERNIPKGVCLDKFHSMYVPYGPHFYRRVNDPRLILYRRGNQRQVKIRERRNDQWDVELTINHEQRVDWVWDDWIHGYEAKIRINALGSPIRIDSDEYFVTKKTTTLLNKVKISHSGLNKEDQRTIEGSSKKINKKIPVYKYYNEYSFTQVIPPINRKKMRPPPFHELLLFPDRLKVNGNVFSFKKQLKQEIIYGLRTGFRFSPIMQSYYEHRIMEEEEDSQKVMASIELMKEDRIDFKGFIPLYEVIRAVRCIYEGNFSTHKDKLNFVKLVKNIILTSSEFIVSQKEFNLGYADIHFAQCFIPTKKHFPYWRQTVCKYTPIPAQIIGSTKYDIEDETYSTWISESSYDQTCFIVGELIGTENYCKISLDVIRLKSMDEKEEGEEEGEDSEEREITLTNRRLLQVQIP